jgi:copper resistance protein B
MKTVLRIPLQSAVLAITCATVVPAIAQDHSMHMPMAMPMPAEQPAAKDVEKKKTKAPAKAAAHKHGGHAAPAPVAQTPLATGHAGMRHDMTMPMAPRAPAAAEPQSVPPSHESMQGMEGMHDMEGMGDMPGMETMSHAPTAPITPIPALTDADRAAAVPPQGGHPVHDNSIQSYTLFNRLETWDADNGAALEWEGQAWIGTDLNRLWLRSEGERVDGRTESADIEVLYGRSVATWWDVVAGIRHDFKPGAPEDFAAIGVIGLAPYKFEVEATVYIGQSGQTAARLEAEYETLLTNRLILQPLVEVNLYGKDDPQRGIGSGLSTLETGLRLRYEFTRRFAPYIGVVREQAFGRTADLRREEGIPSNDTRLVAGIRIWF